MVLASGLTGRWSPSERKSGSIGRGPDAPLVSPACKTGDISDAQHRAGGGIGRNAATALSICPNSARGTITSAIWEAIARPPA
jgi:hypothetical protein